MPKRCSWQVSYRHLYNFDKKKGAPLFMTVSMVIFKAISFYNKTYLWYDSHFIKSRLVKPKFNKFQVASQNQCSMHKYLTKISILFLHLNIQPYLRGVVTQNMFYNVLKALNFNKIDKNYIKCCKISQGLLHWNVFLFLEQ